MAKKEESTEKVVLTAYCTKTKEKNVPFKGIPEITKSGKTFIARGEDVNGNKMCAFLGEAKAMLAIEQKVATKAF